MSRCTEKIDLQGYLENTLTLAEQSAVANHLDGCPACGQRLEEMQRFFSRLNVALAPLPDDAPPADIVDRLIRKAFPQTTQAPELASGLTSGLASGPASGPASGLTSGPASGLTSGLASGLTSGPASGLASGRSLFSIISAWMSRSSMALAGSAIGILLLIGVGARNVLAPSKPSTGSISTPTGSLGISFNLLGRGSLECLEKHDLQLGREGALSRGNTYRLSSPGTVAVAIGGWVDLEFAKGAVFQPLQEMVQMTSGKVTCKLQPKGHPFMVKTPLAEVTALGTVFSVEVASAGVLVSLRHGRISVKTPAQEKLLNEPQTVMIGPDGQICLPDAPSAKESFPPNSTSNSQPGPPPPPFQDPTGDRPHNLGDTF